MDPKRSTAARQDKKQPLTIDDYFTFQEDMSWTLK